MWGLIIALLFSVAACDLQQCFSSSKQGPIFLQRGLRIRPACYGSFDGVVEEEGGSVGTVKDATLAECKRACNREEDCRSFTFCQTWAQCFLKKQNLTGEEPTTRNGDCQSFFKATCGGTANAGFTLRVVSYNLYWWNAFGRPENSWKRESILENIKSNLKPDTIGLQECDSPEVLESLGLQRASPFEAAQGVMSGARLRSVGGGHEDLEATGKWGKRYVTWAEFREGEKAHFWHFNTHWCVHSDEQHTCNEEVRFAGARKMVETIRKVAGDGPVLVTGDFNAQMEERGPQHLLNSGLKLAVNEWVDSIFYSDHWELLAKGAKEASGSDHRPIYAQLRLRQLKHKNASSVDGIVSK